jgi:hypothetical protein
VLESALEITPEPSHLSWTQDVFGNHARPPVSHIGPRSFASKALFVSATLRPASAKPISRVLLGPIHLPTGRKKGPVSRASSRRCPRARRSITGPRASSVRTDRPTPVTFWSI